MPDLTEAELAEFHERTAAEKRFYFVMGLWGLSFLGAAPGLLVGVLLANLAGIWSTDSLGNPVLFALAVANLFGLLQAAVFVISGVRQNAYCVDLVVASKTASATAMGVLCIFGGIEDDRLRLLLGVGSIVDYGMLLSILVFARGIYRWSPNGGYSSQAPQPTDPRSEVAITRPESNLRLIAVMLAVSAATALALDLWLQTGSSDSWARAGNPFFAANSFGALAILLRATWLTASDVRRHFFAFDVANTVLFWVVAVLAGVALLPRLLVQVGVTRGPWDGPFVGPVMAAAGLALVIGIAGRWLANGSLFTGRFFRPTEMRHLETFAQVLIEGPREVVTPEAVARGADAYLAMFDTPRKLAARGGFLLAAEILPNLRFRGPMSRMGYLECREYLDKSFRNGKGIWRSVIRTRQMVLMAYYATSEVWPEIGYQPFPERDRYQQLVAAGEDVSPLPPPAQYLRVNRERFHSCKVCVIGSGAGGAVAAARLAEQFGGGVTIIEAGPYVPAHEFTHYEPAATSRLYKDGGLTTSLDLQMVLLQGACVGGSTVQNNAICFDLPRPVLQGWSNLGADLDESEIRSAQSAVRKRLNVGTLPDNLVPNGSRLFENGVNALASLNDGRISSAQRFEVNFDHCIGCGFCTTGCRYGRKLSMLETCIPDAVDRGATLIPDCEAVSLDIRDGKAQGLKCRLDHKYDLYIKADYFVVACGTVASSLLLKQSGVKGPVGEKMSFNLATTVSADFEEVVNGFDGVQMCSYARCDGFLLESLFNPPSAYALTMPGWFLDHYQNMRRYNHLANGGVMVPSPPIGRLDHLPVVGKFGPNFDYPLAQDSQTMARLKTGLGMLAEVYLAAGATRVLPSTYADIVIRTKADIGQIDAAVQKPEDILVASAHPQGGNAINADPARGVVDTSLQVHGLANVVVCDASVFPTGVGVNPQLSVMTVALYGAERLARRMAAEPPRL